MIGVFSRIIPSVIFNELFAAHTLTEAFIAVIGEMNFQVLGFDGSQEVKKF
jgi:hypothetical protein